MNNNTKYRQRVSGRHNNGVNAAAQPLPRGGSDMAAKRQRVYIRTFG
jgi:hypothetical protein